MKAKSLFALLGVLVLGTAAAGGAWYWRHSHDPMAIARAAMSHDDLRTARIALRTVVRDTPDNAEAHFRLGKVELALGDPVAAERELRLAAARGWDTGQTAPLLARALLAQGRFGDVLNDFPVDGLPPGRAAPLLVARALAHSGLQEDGKAAAVIAEAERLAPDGVEAPLAAARIALARNDAAAAETKVDRALALDPRSVEALLLKGALRRAGGDDAAALANFDAGIAIAPESPGLRLERAGTLIAMNQDRKAREDVAAVLSADARNPAANYLQSVLLVRAGDWAGAEAALQKAGPDAGRFPRGEYFLALIKINLDQVEQATSAANHYVAHAPRDAAGYKLLARIEASAGRPQQEIEVLNRAVAAGLADAELLGLLGDTYVRVGQGARAVETLDRAAALAGDNPAALTRLAALRLGAGDAGGAERTLARALEIAPDQPGTGEQLVTAALVAGDIDRAAAALERLRHQPTADPARIEALTGLVRLARLDYDGARAAFEAALKADPKATAARLDLARILALQGHPAEAEAMLEAVLRAEPANAAALAGISGPLLARQRGDRLIELLEAARKAAPGNADLAIAQAQVLADTGKAAGALALLDALPREQAERPGVLAMRARLQAGLGQAREAQVTYRRILAATPGDGDARGRLVTLLLQAGDPEGAKEVLRSGLEAMPGNLPLLQACVALDERTGGLDAALQTATRLAAETAQLPAARLLKGGLYMALRRYPEAAAAYQAELTASPSGPLAAATALALDAAGRQAEATRLLTDWIGRHPDDIGAMQALAGLDLRNRRLDDAGRVLDAVLARQPDNPVALNNRAWIYQQRNDPRALALARKAFLLSPAPQVADTLGWILVNQGDAATALPLLRQAAGQGKTDPALLYHLAVALNATGHQDDAVAVLTALVRAEGDFADKPAARRLLDTLGRPKTGSR